MHFLMILSMKLAFFTTATHWVNTFFEISTSTAGSLSYTVIGSSEPIDLYAELGFFAPMYITLHLFTLKHICHFVAHSSSIERSFWSFIQSLLVSIAKISYWHPLSCVLALNQLLIHEPSNSLIAVSSEVFGDGPYQMPSESPYTRCPQVLPHPHACWPFQRIEARINLYKTQADFPWARPANLCVLQFYL